MCQSVSLLITPAMSESKGPRCETDVNECQVLSGTVQGCQNGAACVNTPGSFRCLDTFITAAKRERCSLHLGSNWPLVAVRCDCLPEWSGSLCTVRYDDCRNGGQDQCSHGTCIDADRVVTGQVLIWFLAYKKYPAVLVYIHYFAGFFFF